MINKLRHLVTIVKNNNIDLNGWDKCAIGFACKDELFQNKGLRFKLLENGASLPSYNDKWTFEAAADFFNITLRESLKFFSSLNTANKNVLIDKLEEFIYSEEAPCGAD